MDTQNSRGELRGRKMPPAIQMGSLTKGALFLVSISRGAEEGHPASALHSHVGQTPGGPWELRVKR